MFTKCITLITLTAFIIFTLSCGSTTKYLSLDSVSEYEKQKINITRVQKTTGEDIQFTDASDIITENSIVGEAIIGNEIHEEITIPLSDVNEIEFSKRNHIKSTASGASFGFLSGGILGYLLGVNDGKFGEQNIPYYAFLFGGIVGGFHLLKGAVIGISENYILTAPADSAAQKNDIEQ